MREESWTCHCGAKLVLRWPSHAHLTNTRAVACPECEKPSLHIAGLPLEFYRADENGKLQLIDTYEDRP
jgi:DNA-directed RNA polymerase subunit RPC12/RpoP